MYSDMPVTFLLALLPTCRNMLWILGSPASIIIFAYPLSACGLEWENDRDGAGSVLSTMTSMSRVARFPDTSMPSKEYKCAPSAINPGPIDTEDDRYGSILGSPSSAEVETMIPFLSVTFHIRVDSFEIPTLLPITLCRLPLESCINASISGGVLSTSNTDW